MSETFLELKWTISRAADTYGYNRLTLTDTDSGRKFVALGGGYDMIGAVFGEWLQANHAEKLQAIADRAAYEWTGRKPLNRSSERDSLYGLSAYRDERGNLERVRLDGACGLSSMRTIAEAVGLKVRALSNRRGHVVGFVVSDGE